MSERWLTAKEIGESRELKPGTISRLLQDTPCRSVTRHGRNGGMHYEWRESDVRAAFAARDKAEREKRRLRAECVRLWNEGYSGPDIVDLTGLDRNVVRYALSRAGIRQVRRPRKVTKATAPICARCGIILAEAEAIMPGGDDSLCAFCKHEKQHGKMAVYWELARVAA